MNGNRCAPPSLKEAADAANSAALKSHSGAAGSVIIAGILRLTARET